MRKLTPVLLGIATLFGISACSPGLPVEKKPEPQPETPTVAEGFPKGWSQWPKFNDEPVIRTEQSEARDLHYNGKAEGSTSGAFPEGTVLVKAHHTLLNGGKGQLTRLSVMTKGSGEENGGWTFGVFTPEGKKKEFNKDGCALCHAQRADNDHVFSNRSGL